MDIRTMKKFGYFVKAEVLLLAIVSLSLIDIIETAVHPQVFKEKNNDSDTKLPPKVFPEGAIHGELPPAIFPDDKALQAYAVSSTTRINKNVLSKGKGELGNATASANNNSDKTKHSDKPGKEASEVQDLLNFNKTEIPVFEDTTENSFNNDTEIVTGLHVTNDSKTHEEDVTKSSSDNKTVSKSNETVQDHKDTENQTASNITMTNTTTEEYSLVSSTHSTLNVNKTESEDKQNSTVSATIEDNVTSNVTDIGNNTTTEETEHNGNETNIMETKNVENSTEAAEHNNTTPVIEISSVIADSENASIATKTEEKTKTETSQKDDKAKLETSTAAPVVSVKTSVNTDNSKEVTTPTIQPTLKFETTSVNISENIIDHKADIPVALAASQQHADHSHASSGKSSAFLQPTESAAILAGVFVAIALLGYVGLLIWRRVLEKRYGNREMLVNEDDFYDTNDLRNFEL